MIILKNKENYLFLCLMKLKYNINNFYYSKII